MRKIFEGILIIIIMVLGFNVYQGNKVNNILQAKKAEVKTVYEDKIIYEDKIVNKDTEKTTIYVTQLETQIELLINKVENGLNINGDKVYRLTEQQKIDFERYKLVDAEFNKILDYPYKGIISTGAYKERNLQLEEIDFLRMEGPSIKAMVFKKFPH